MILASLSPRDRRALRVAALIGAAALIVVLGLRPAWRAYVDASDELALERRTLARERGLVAASPRIRAARTEGARRMADLAPRVFVVPSANLASAALAGYVRELADSVGVTIAQLTPPESPDDRVRFGPVAVQVQGRGDLEGVLGLLRALESGPKLVRLDSIDIAAAGGGTAATPPAVAAGTDGVGDGESPPDHEAAEPLTLSFTATGFMHLRIVDRGSVAAARSVSADGDEP
jgi:hypothetical protein